MFSVKFLLVLLALFSVALVRADDDSTPILNAIDRGLVQDAQAAYNFHLDNLFNIGCTLNDSAINAAADLLMQTFCRDGIFHSWTAATPPFAAAVPGATTNAQLRALYISISKTVFSCGSQHSVMNANVKFGRDSVGRKTAVFTSRLWQLATLASAGGAWADIMGWYQNVYTKQVNGDWCMSTFYSGNDPIIVRSPTANTDVLQVPGAIQIVHLPVLP